MMDRVQRQSEMAVRGKYRRLYSHLSSLSADEWRATFGEVESVLGFELPASARLHRPWWANQKIGNGHSQCLAWSVAGWETVDVDMDAETLLFRRRKRSDPTLMNTLDEIWPVHPTAELPHDMKLRREDLYYEGT